MRGFNRAAWLGAQHKGEERATREGFGPCACDPQADPNEGPRCERCRFVDSILDEERDYLLEQQD